MKTTFKYDHYYDYQEIEKFLDHFCENYPELIEVKTNCLSEENRRQFVVTISNRNTGDPDKKPALYIDGNIHAGEVTSSMAALHTIDYLLSNHDDEEIAALLENNTVYVIPRVSPDGAETYLKTPYSLRSVNIKHNEENGGIRQEDVDGDGCIMMMAIASPYGSFKKDNDGNMVLRSPSDNKGTFYDIYPEGFLKKYDGDENLKVRKSDWDLDFNRNFPYGWFPEGRQPGAGKYPLSNVETKAIADFVLAHPNICGALIGHTSGGLILFPPGTRASEKVPYEDIQILKAIASMGQEELGYVPLNLFDSFIQNKDAYDSGALDDWMFETQGIPAFTVEFWDISSKAGVPVDWKSKERDIKKEYEHFTAIMKWVKENAPEYYHEWKQVDHPDFGKVEIGGINHKYTVQNPPEKFLLNELEADTRFNIRFIKALPSVIIDDLNIKDLGDNIYQIDLIIGNTSYLPVNLTKTAAGAKTAKPITVNIEGCELLSGNKEEKIDDLEGFSSSISHIGMHGNIATYQRAKSRKKISWIIKAAKGQKIDISISHPKAGHIQKTLVIE